jgi:hypothetical protein
VPKPKPSTIKLQVFKGREAKLNKAIFHTLALKGPQTIYDIHKQVKANRGFRYMKYSSVNKRVRALEGSSYIKKMGNRKTKAGFEAQTYELKVKSYLALLLDSVSLEELLDRLDEDSGSAILADVAFMIE